MGLEPAVMASVTTAPLPAEALPRSVVFDLHPAKLHLQTDTSKEESRYLNLGLSTSKRLEWEVEVLLPVPLPSAVSAASSVVVNCTIKYAK